MLCDICKKKEAVVHIQEVSSDGKKMINLCNDCLEKNKNNDPLLKYTNFSFTEVLENIKKISADMLQKKNPAPSPVCPECGWDKQKMADNNGLLGCANCYNTFKNMVQNTVENIHHSHIHTGKRPDNCKNEPLEIKKEKLRKLESELISAVQSEKYEHAAVLRDEIAALKKLLQKESGKK